MRNDWTKEQFDMEAAQEFLNWMKSEEGKEVIKGVGLITVD